jgi:hypothetical protein
MKLKNTQKELEELKEKYNKLQDKLKKGTVKIDSPGIQQPSPSESMKKMESKSSSMESNVNSIFSPTQPKDKATSVLKSAAFTSKRNSAVSSHRELELHYAAVLNATTDSLKAEEGEEENVRSSDDEHFHQGIILLNQKEDDEK